MKRYFFILATIALLYSCDKHLEKEAISYESVHFKITDSLDYTIIEVKQPFVGSAITERYLLYPKGTEEPQSVSAMHKIAIPVDRVAINSTTHLGYLLELKQSDKVVAASNLNLYYDTLFSNQIDANQVASIGNQTLNEESLIQQNTDVLFSFAIDASAYKKVEQLRKLGQKVILVSEYMEQDPLTKAEWIKVFSRFFELDCRNTADSIYAVVSEEYNKVKQMATAHQDKPSVMMGLPWKGTWYVSGGNSFQAKLIEDAGGAYIWKPYEQEGGVPLNIETVYEQALNADYWINPGIAQGLSIIEEKNPLFKQFKPYKTKQIYSNYLRSNHFGANDYWERGVVRPDLILKDLMTIFHQDTFANQLHFYQVLR